MPVVFEKREKSHHLAIWQVKESTDELLHLLQPDPDSLSGWSQFRSEKRKREWLAVRLLLHYLLPAHAGMPIRYDTYGKPFLDAPYTLSVSHTHEYVALLITELSCAGIDLETLRHRIPDIAHKFISTAERVYLGEQPSMQQLHIVWGVKEVLYKMYGRKELDFREHLSADSFVPGPSGMVTGRIRKGNYSFESPVHYLEWNGMMLAWAVK